MKSYNVLLSLLLGLTSAWAFQQPFHRHTIALPRVVAPMAKSDSTTMTGAAAARIDPRSRTSLKMSESTALAEDAPEKKGFFGKIKSIIPPKQEREKLGPLALMFFCILFSYTILRDTKDVLMVTAPKSGAEGMIELC